MESSTKKKMLVVSSYNRPCGIAQYLEHLEPELRNQSDFDVEIAALPVDLLRSEAKHARKLSEKAFNEILQNAKDVDVVNIQFEPGLFGYTPFLIWKRLDKLINVSRRVILTYHTVPLGTSVRFGFSKAALKKYLNSWRGRYIFDRLFQKIRSNPDKFINIVQTKREAKGFELLGLPKERIFDSPLAFLSVEQKKVFESERGNILLEVKRNYGAEGRLIGCFGFLSPYKGIEVAIRALKYLPQEYSLLVVGGLHPEGIEHGTVEQKYIKSLIEEIEADNLSMQKNSDPSRVAISGRVHFCGAPDNLEFNRIMIACDSIVLPYAEVGQTSSGPAAIALDMNKSVYCSRTHCFRELDKYQKGILSFFEVGNHMELAERIRLSDGSREIRTEARKEYSERYNVNTRAGLYKKAFEILVIS
ncbi:hypothetical protein HBN99_15060 [Pseudomonas oryzihabitans]|uniref:hypothetical protein n=1 Tax=Pseudomonas oryzihabitans TaxID=47885 RepID=UPI0014762BCF|nr:hypothetical protein [Pseudomonas oryzihabitans]NMZ65637.1 hypothetical protein [Pseudomonas oryzihabitans]